MKENRNGTLLEIVEPPQPEAIVLPKDGQTAGQGGNLSAKSPPLTAIPKHWRHRMIDGISRHSALHLSRLSAIPTAWSHSGIADVGSHFLERFPMLKFAGTAVESDGLAEIPALDESSLGPVRRADLREEDVRQVQQVWSRLALHLLRMEQLKAPWAVGVTSAIHSEGRTTSALGIAIALAAETDQPVLLVEAYLHKPTVAADCRVDPTPGITDYLLGRRQLKCAFRRTALSNLTVAIAGNGVSPASNISNDELAGKFRRKLPLILTEIKQKFPYIVLDLPPLLGTTDAVEMTHSLDGTLLVVRAGVTPSEKVRVAAGLLDEAKLIGVIHIGSFSAIPRWLSQLISG